MEIFLLSITDIWQSTNSKKVLGAYSSIEKALETAADHDLLTYNCKIKSMENLDGHVVIESVSINSSDLEDFTKVWCTERSECYQQLAEMTHAAILETKTDTIKISAVDEDDVYYTPIMDQEMTDRILKYSQGAQLGVFEADVNAKGRTVKIPCVLKWWIVK